MKNHPLRSSRNEKPKKPEKPAPASTTQALDGATLQRFLSAPYQVSADQFVALQKTLGNRLTQRLLDESRGSETDFKAKPGIDQAAAQRTVWDGRPRKQTRDQVLNYLKANNNDKYQAWLLIGESDLTLLQRIDGYNLDTAGDHKLWDMAKLLDRDIKVALFASDQTILDPDGIEVKIWNIAKTFPGGLDKESKPADSFNVDTKIMSITAEIAIDGLPNAISNWELGFVQTVMSLERYITIAHEGGEVQQQKTTLPGPTRDGPSAYPGPWFDPSSFQPFTAAKAPVTVTMRDRPGISLQLQKTAVGANVVGKDTFKTWLVLRHKGDHRVIYLRMWTWETNYSGAGITGGAESLDNGNDAVLGGAVGKDSFIETGWDTHELPTQFKYRQMKKDATKAATPLSKAMPVKTYGQLVANFTRKIADGDFGAAAVFLQTIKDNLTLMDNKGSNYWKSPLLKTQKFQPIMDAVDKMIDYVQKLG